MSILSKILSNRGLAVRLQTAFKFIKYIIYLHIWRDFLAMLDINFFKKYLNLSPKEEFLIKLYVSQTVTKEQIFHLLHDFDYNIEKEKLTFNFLLANLFLNNPHIEIPKDIKPRLEGVIRLFQYYNVPLMLGLKQLTQELNKQNIPVMFVKGAAMRILESDKARMMYDVDCAVPKDKFNETVEIGKKLGFTVRKNYWNAAEIIKKDKQVIDIHHTLVKSDINSDKIYKRIFERAKEYDFCGSKVLIAGVEDMIFLLLNNGFDNIIYSQPFYKNVSWLLDGVYIIKKNKNINWKFIIENAQYTGTLAQTKIMLELFNRFVPNTVSENILSSINISEKQQKDFNFYTKTHLFFSKAQQLKIKMRKCRSFSDGINLFSRFLYLKMIQKIPVINNLFFEKVADRMFEI